MILKRCLLLILFVLFILNGTHFIYLNIFTHSLPYGLYIKIKGTPQRNDYAASCLTQDISQYGIQRGYLVQGGCPTGTVRVLKIIKGIPGDHFEIKNGALKINGHSYFIYDRDSSGRILKVFYQEKDGILNENQFLLLSDFVKNSWDSRYWGPVSVQFLLKPLIIVDNVKYP